MTGHQINSLVGDLVAMAQAMEELPRVRHELAENTAMFNDLLKRKEQVEADLQQARDYAATLEQKVRDAEVAKDAAETMFLEADDRAGKAIHLLAGVIEEARLVESEVSRSIAFLSPPKPEPIAEVKPEPTEVWPSDSTAPVGESASPLPSMDIGSVSQPSSDTTAQGQSEPDPIVATETIGSIHAASDMNVSGLVDAHSTSEPSWAAPTPPAQPYAGKNYFDWPAYVPYADWIAGGGTTEDYYERRVGNPG